MKARDLRGRIISLTRQLEIARHELEDIERRCLHDWTEPEYKPEHYPGYTDSGDPPGTMGVDRRLPTFVSARTVDKWVRVCRLCGKEEETTRTGIAEVRRQPIF